MHVAFLSHEYPPFIYGGVGTFVRNLAIGLSRKGIRTTVVTGYPSQSKGVKRIETDERQDTDIDVVRFPYPDIPPRHTLFQLLNLKKIYETVRSINADVIHGQSGSTFPASLGLKNLAPLVVTFHSSPKAEERMSVYALSRDKSFSDFWTYGIGYPSWSYTFRRELSCSNAAVAVSKTLMSELVEEMGAEYAEKMCKIHNGVDIETLDKEYGDDKKEPDDAILYAGRLFWRKGPLNLIQLAYLLRKDRVPLRIIAHGQGPLLGRMKKEIRDLGLTNIELKGFTTREQLMDSIRRSKFIVVPSFYEACPMILLESMCLGKIPIAFELPYALEFTENGKYGILAKNVKDMAAKIKSIYEYDDAQHLSSSIRAYSRKKYDMNEVASEYCHVYRRVQNQI